MIDITRKKFEKSILKLIQEHGPARIGVIVEKIIREDMQLSRRKSLKLITDSVSGLHPLSEEEKQRALDRWLADAERGLVDETEQAIDAIEGGL